MNLNRTSTVLAGFTMAAAMFMGAGCSSAPQPAQPGTAATQTVPVATQKTVTSDEVAKHATQNDCWMIVDGKVYDLTSYFGQHPGGDQTLAPNCGKDASQAYASKGNKGQPHTPRADLQLATYLIGTLAK